MKPGVSAATCSRLTSGCELDLLGVDLKDLDAALLVRPVDQDLAVEAARAQQRRVEDLRPVGRGEQDDALARVEAVELDQELIEGLLLLVVAAGHRADAARAAHRVELVDEDDAGRHLARLLEQIAHARGADADEHLDELGARDREEPDARLARDRAREQRLAGARGPDQQHAARQARAEHAVALGVLQELDDLLQLGLGLVDAGDVGEGRLGVLLDVDLGAALADRHQAAGAHAARRHAPQQEDPDAEEDQRRHDPGQKCREEVLVAAAAIGDAVLFELAREVEIDPRGHEAAGLALGRLLDLADDAALGDQQIVDLALLEVVEELAVGQRLGLARLLDDRLHDQDRQHRDQDIPGVEVALLVHHPTFHPTRQRCVGARRSSSWSGRRQRAGGRLHARRRLGRQPSDDCLAKASS